MKYTEEQIAEVKEHIKILKDTLAKEEVLLDDMLTICPEIKQGMPTPINQTMRFYTLVSWGILVAFIVTALVFVIGQQAYGLWQNAILSQGQRGVLSLIGIIIVTITGILTISTYKPWKTTSRS